FRPVARQGGDRARAGRRFLGSRTGTPGLSRAFSRRLHLPLRAAELEAAATQGRRRKQRRMSVAAVVCIVGRSSSHFTRLARIFAAELGVAYRFEAVLDLTSLDAHDYAGNPALKLPVLKLAGATVYGAENICRTLAELAPQPKRVIWPADLRDTMQR